MPVRRFIHQPDGVFFITITCARWMSLFSTYNCFHVVYKWFDHLKSKGHVITGYVIMPDHFHALIAFRNSSQSINTIVANGKRFMAYEIVQIIKDKGGNDHLNEMKLLVNETDKKRNKKHEVFEPSFDWKECNSQKFVDQKLSYMHCNPCKTEPWLSPYPPSYVHSSAKFYIEHIHSIYPVTSFMELEDIDLTRPV
jgi:REP element-mobilizing transposase RayT